MLTIQVYHVCVFQGIPLVTSRKKEDLIPDRVLYLLSHHCVTTQYARSKGDRQVRIMQKLGVLLKGRKQKTQCMYLGTSWK